MGDKQVIINQLLDTQNKIIEAINSTKEEIKDNRKEIKQDIKNLSDKVIGMDIKIERNATNIKWIKGIGSSVSAVVLSAIGALFAKVLRLF